MGITIFKIFILRGIVADLWSEITFYGSAYFPVKLNFRPYIQKYTFPMKILNTFIPLLAVIVSHFNEHFKVEITAIGYDTHFQKGKDFKVPFI